MATETCATPSSRNIDYSFFFKLPTRPQMNKDCVAKCKTCLKDYKFTLTTKGNLLKHLQTSHSHLLRNHREERQRQLASSNQMLLTSDVQAKKKPEFKNQDKIATSVALNLCGRGGLALQMVEQPWFRSFMADVEPRFTPISRVSVKRKLNDLYTHDKELFLKEISALRPKPTVTADFWTARDGRNFLGCTIHFITEAGSLKNSLLFFKEVPPPHTSINVRNRFEDELDRVKVLCFLVVTDNAANMKSAFTMELDDEFPCPTGNNESDTDSEDENTATLSQWTSQPLSHFEGWIGCAAHQLQLVVHDGYKELLNYRRVQAAFKKAKAICTLSRQSSHFRYALQEKRIPTANETRWNSYLRMHKYILRHVDLINTALVSCNHLTLTITTTDKENLQGVVDVLEYFAEGTDILQRENEPTSCRVIPVVDSLENAINSVPRDNTAINALCEALKNSLEKHFRYLLDSTVHQASTALDPRIKLTFTNNHTEGKFFKFYPTTVKDKIKELLPQTNSIAPPTSEVVSTPTTNDVSLDSEGEPQKKKCLLDFSSVVVHGSSTNENDVELQAYFDHPTLAMKPLPFWCERKVTSLSTLALQLHSVPSSSAPVERLFSKAGIVLSQRRTRLKNEQLEQLLFYK